MNHADYLAAWQVCADMFGWHRTESLVGTIDRAWRLDQWLADVTARTADLAIRRLEQQHGDGRRIVPASFLHTLRVEHDIANPKRTPKPDLTRPLTQTELETNARGIALCRWVLTERHHGREPTLSNIEHKQDDPNLLTEHGRGGDSRRTPAQLLAGDTADAS